jgi:hypothetical protein
MFFSHNLSDRWSIWFFSPNISRLLGLMGPSCSGGASMSVPLPVPWERVHSLQHGRGPNWQVAVFIHFQKIATICEKKYVCLKMPPLGCLRAELLASEELHYLRLHITVLRKLVYLFFCQCSVIFPPSVFRAWCSTKVRDNGQHVQVHTQNIRGAPCKISCSAALNG